MPPSGAVPRSPGPSSSGLPSSGLKSRTVRRYLAARGLADGPELEAFLHPKLAQLTPPGAMVDRSLAAERLARAVRGRETIAVFGDYDCDGMTATAILTDGLRRLGAVVEPLLASRFDGGYGLSEPALRRLSARSPGLVVTCDCGSSDHVTLAELRQSGVDAIVVDHHLVPDEPLPVLAFLNPHRADCGFPFKWLASCGLSLSLLGEVRALLGATLDLRDYLDLVAIGTIADVAPLHGDNRALVRAGLERLRSSERPGLYALCELASVGQGYPVLAGDVAFRIAPRLNAPGRLGAPDLSLELLLEQSPTQARILAERLEQVTTARKREQERIEAEARRAVRELSEEAAAVVLAGDDWNHGIVGIVAGRLADELGRPAVVIGFDADIGRGSVRGPAGFPLHDAVARCQQHLQRFGGHQAAAGLTVGRAELEAFRSAFVSACAELKASVAAPAKAAALLVDQEDELEQVLFDLGLLEPCGAGNPLPQLELAGRVKSVRALRGGHLKLEIELSSGGALSAFGPNLGELESRVSARMGQVVALRGELRPDRYRGGGAVELLLRDLSGFEG